MQYDDTNDALTLGDDDALRVGDYDIRYNSTSGDWEAVYTPTGDVSSVPANQSGSLFPTDFADALAGKALADDGNLYDTVQGAENAATDWMFVGPGTFAEAVVIDTAGLTVMGSGYDTLIDGGITSHAIAIDVADVTVQNLSVQTTAAGGNAYRGIIARSTGTGDNITIQGCTVRDSDDNGIEMNAGTDHLIENCTVEAADGYGIETASVRTIITNCYATGCVVGIYASTGSDDSIITNCITDTTSNDGINGSSPDQLIGGNRIHNAGDHGIQVGGTDQIIFNNRVSGSTNADIDTAGATTPTTDGNSTGLAN